MIKKLFSIFAALTLSVGLWAQSIEEIRENAIGEISRQAEMAIKEINDAIAGYESSQEIQGIAGNAKYAIEDISNEAEIKIEVEEDANEIQSTKDKAIAQINAYKTQALKDIEEAKKAAAAGITVNVTVPAGTPACYFYGEMSGNAFAEMTKVDDTHYTLEFPTATTIGWGYRFAWENGNWNTANADPAGDIKVEPEDGVINIEIKAWVTAPAPATVKATYIDENGASQEVDAIEITDATEAVTWAAGWYVVTGTDVQLAKGAVCNGAVNLILADGAKLTATGADNAAGIQVFDEGNSLTIYGQTNQTGELIANGGAGGAGIGGGKKGNGSNITINGGIITANGGENAAGIGGGSLGNGTNITINGGTVTANGGGCAAGIGGGTGGGEGDKAGGGSNITINGGIVTANGGGLGAGIGGGSDSHNSSNITINGGMVTANGGEAAAGIGAGDCGSCSNIIIATDLVVKADGNNPPTTVIANDGSDLASSLAGKRYATVETPAAPVVGDQFEDATSGLKFEVTAVEETPTVRVIANNYTGTSYTVPASVKYNEDDFTVTEIGELAFEYCSTLESITLPASVTTIESNAFSGCSSLESITLPANLTEIGSSAFSLCTGLQSITIPASVATIGKWAFSQRYIPGPPAIPARVATIGKRASQNSSALTSVTFLGNACQDAIGNNAFYGVGEDAPAALTLPTNWTGTLPDEEGNWYEGKFELVSGPTALPTLFGEGVKGNKFMHNGQVIIRKGEKNYNILGTKVK